MCRNFKIYYATTKEDILLIARNRLYVCINSLYMPTTRLYPLWQKTPLIAAIRGVFTRHGWGSTLVPNCQAASLRTSIFLTVG